MASGRDALGALLEEPSTPSHVDSLQLGLEVEENGEPVPSLASLLLSTAESLATRSKAIKQENSATSAPKAKPPPSFALVANPGALLASPASKEYLASLLAMPLPTLLALPNQLATLSTSLDTDLSSLAFTRYSSFLLAHAATQSISTSFSSLSANLSSFVESTDALKQVVKGFEQRVSEPRKKRERMALVRERMEEVEELMEAPSVVDACVRAGYWAEAIDVAIRLSDLHRRLSTNASRASSNEGEGVGALRLLDRVREDVSVALLSLRARVLDSLLQRGLKLPGAVRGVGILRRIGERGFGVIEEGASSKELDEDALRVVFLAARWRCLRGELESVEGQMAASGIEFAESEARTTQQSEDPDAQVGAEENEERTRWTKRWIEVWREIVGETVGMYTEVFLSSLPLATAAASNTPHALPSTAPLALFLTTSLTSLSDILAHALPSLTSPSSLSSLLTQLSYCSHSFARHGLEFRELQQLRERVEVRVGRIVIVEWETAGRKWEKEWRDGWEGSPSSAASAAMSRRNRLLGGRAPISDWLVSPEGLAQVLATPLPPAVDLQALPTTWHHQPSQPLALLPPLARFLNTHATALNALRLLPPLALYPSFLAAQARELDRATQVLAAFTEAWLASLSTLPNIDLSIPEDQLSKEELQLRQMREDEKQLVIFAVAAFGRWVVPWCEGGLKKGVYGELAQKGMAKEEREQGIVDAIRRVEGIIARIEGRPVSSSPVPTPVKETPPSLDLRLNGDSDHTAIGSIGLDASPTAEVAPIPFDPSPLDKATVDPVIVEASIVANDHLPEDEPPAIQQAEDDATLQLSQEEPDEPSPPSSLAAAAPSATLDTAQPLTEEPSAPEVSQTIPSDERRAESLKELPAPRAEVRSNEEPAARVASVVQEQEDASISVRVAKDHHAQPIILDPSVSDPSPIISSIPTSDSSAPVSSQEEKTDVDELETALAEESALDAPIEDLDVDKMPLDHPPAKSEELKSSQHEDREEPEVEIALEEPAAGAGGAGPPEAEQEEPAVIAEGAEEVTGDEENEEDDAWGI